MTPSASPSHDLRPRSWREIVAPYSQADHRHAVGQLLSTGLPFLGLMAALVYFAYPSHGLVLPLAVPAAALLVRLFMIQHDCGHGSFFKSRLANDLLGRALGVLTLTPYAFWRKSHAVHHATSGNLDRRGTGDITTLTVREYMALPAWRRMLYRLYRHPLVLFGIGPVFQFIVRHRIPTSSPRRDAQTWVSILGTNAGIAAVVVLAVLLVGARSFVLGYLPVILLASSIGVWLFYVQHQFEHSYWEPEESWNFHTAALEGSSFYDLPGILHWLTGYIGFHHIHHLASKVPNYRLRECFQQNPEFWQAKRLTLLSSLKCPRLTLWDEERRLLVTFREALAKRCEQASAALMPRRAAT